MYQDVKISPITSIELNCGDNEQINIPVIEGVAYAPLFFNNYIRILAALKETPEELDRNHDVKLIYVNEKKEE